MRKGIRALLANARSDAPSAKFDQVVEDIREMRDPTPNKPYFTSDYGPAEMREPSDVLYGKQLVKIDLPNEMARVILSQTWGELTTVAEQMGVDAGTLHVWADKKQKGEYDTNARVSSDSGDLDIGDDSGRSAI